MLESPDYFFRVREIGRLRQTRRRPGFEARPYVFCECASGARAKERGEGEKYVWCICTGFCALAECNYKYTTRNYHMTGSHCTTQSHFSVSGGSYGYRLRW